MDVHSHHILALLRDKHSKEVFVSECKDGPSQLGSHNRMDAWVMARSWAHPAVTAYEIKVSRADFLGDQKWHKYLDFCNYFYFAAPPGIIAPNELPPEVGLYVTSTNAARLFCKKKATLREVAIPENVFRYILMCRAKIGSERGPEDTRTTAYEFWKAWLEGKRDCRDMGHRVSRAIREAVSKKVIEVELKQFALEKTLETYAVFRENLKKLGLCPDAPLDRWVAKNAVEKWQAGGGQEILDALDGIIKVAEREKRDLEKELRRVSEQL